MRRMGRNKMGGGGRFPFLVPESLRALRVQKRSHFTFDGHFTGAATRAAVRQAILRRFTNSKREVEVGVLKIMHDSATSSLLRFA